MRLCTRRISDLYSWSVRTLLSSRSESGTPDSGRPGTSGLGLRDIFTLGVRPCFGGWSGVKVVCFGSDWLSGPDEVSGRVHLLKEGSPRSTYLEWASGFRV